MNREEFSNSFDTLLNSYASTQQFGEDVSKRDITLDEYQKSVLLSLAQDIVVRSYFDGTLNAEHAGFDENTKRQVDFSSLIAVNSMAPAEDQSTVFDTRGILYIMPLRHYVKGVSVFDYSYDSTFKPSDQTCVTDVLYILNEKLICQDGNNIKEYVVVPINYKKYDQEMSKPYSQPLKKQAWRLFQNINYGFDIKSELIPRWNLTKNERIVDYRIRYIRRPKPIILVNLADGLSIEGYNTARDCELSSILHGDILRKAVELAYTMFVGKSAEPSNNANV